jgi:hypothetical protein
MFCHSTNPLALSLASLYAKSVALKWLGTMMWASPCACTAMIERVAVPILLSVHALLLAYSASLHSPTPDELVYLPAGIEHWRTMNFEFARVNPPLVRLMAAVPVLICECRTDPTRHNGAPGQRTEHLVGQDFLAVNGPRTFALVTIARYVCILFGVFGASVCWLWARSLYGPRSGLCALTLWCFCPNILGHGALITPDVASAACGVASAYAFWRWLRNPVLHHAVCAGLLLGVAQLTKANWVILFVLWPIVWFVWTSSPGTERYGEKPLVPLRQLATILAAGIAIINVGYGFQGTGKALGDFLFVSDGLRGQISEGEDAAAALGNVFSNTMVSRVPVLLPEQYVLGIDLQRFAAEHGRPAYLLGEWKGGGWWYYYIVAGVVKLPLGVLLLIVLSAVVRLRQGNCLSEVRDDVVLLMPAIATALLISAHIGINRHFRYALPVLPFVFIWASGLFGERTQFHRSVVAVGAGALIWSVSSSLLVYPHSLSYFNELVGGPRGGPQVLLDSNTDWGQDLLLLKRWIDDHPAATPLFVGWHLPHVRPGLVGISAPRPPLTPVAGWHIVSVNEVFGLDTRYRYFKRFRPVGSIGYSMNIYHLTEEDVRR